MRGGIEQNTDQWIFDYLEQKLTPSDIMLFENYLAHHPDCRKEVDKWRLTYLSRPTGKSYDLESVLVQPESTVNKWWKSFGLIISVVFIVAGILLFLLTETASEQLSKHGNDHIEDNKMSHIPKSDTLNVRKEVRKRVVAKKELYVQNEFVNEDTTILNTLAKEVTVNSTEIRENVVQEVRDEITEMKPEAVSESLITPPSKKASNKDGMYEKAVHKPVKNIVEITSSSEIDIERPTILDTVKVNDLEQAPLKSLLEGSEVQEKRKQGTKKETEVKKNTKHKRDRLNNFDLRPDNNFIETNDDF